jgi:hypothetical protein
MQGQFKRHDIPVESDFAATQIAKEAHSLLATVVFASIVAIETLT